MGAKRGFTLIELLIVVGIVAILSAVLLPVFAISREKGRRTQCIANERSLGAAIFQYAQDFDERLPNGTNPMTDDFWAGQGWAGQVRAYGPSPESFRCPSDVTKSPSAVDNIVSYGYNIDLVQGSGYYVGVPPPGVSLSTLTAPAATVMLFEVSGVTANVADLLEGGGNGGTPGADMSASGNGIDHRLYAQRTAITLPVNAYATGYMASRQPSAPTQFPDFGGRHIGGSNYLLADGHVQWLTGEKVSTGGRAKGTYCAQDNAPSVADCTYNAGEVHAAGVAAAVSQHMLTFSGV